MKFVSKKLSLVLASAVLVLAGCSKNKRPDPSATVLGPTPVGAGAMNNLPPSSIDIPQNIATRDPNMGPDGDRTTLAAYTIYFEFDQSAIRASERDKLKAVKDYLDKTPSARLVLEGHCDWRGTADYNLGLGDRRANSVKKYLQSVGGAADRLETISKGSLEASKNADDATMAKDRRVNIIVAAPRGPVAL